MDSSSEEDSLNSETRREWATQDDMSKSECVYSTLISTLMSVLTPDREELRRSLAEIERVQSAKKSKPIGKKRGTIRLF